MKLLMHRLQPRRIDMGVNLRGGDAGVAEHFLYLPQIRPAGEHVRGKTMPQRMRTDFLRHVHAPGVSFKQFPNPFPPQPPAAITQQTPIPPWPPVCRPVFAARFPDRLLTAAIALAPNGTMRSLSPLPRHIQ